MPEIVVTASEGLAWLLLPVGEAERAGGLGKEEGRIAADGISLLKDPYGSHRYVYARNGQILAGLQVMSRDGITGYLANAYTAPEARRSGLGRQLMQRAQQDFEMLIPSEHLSESGAAFQDATVRAPHRGGLVVTAAWSPGDPEGPPEVVEALTAFVRDVLDAEAWKLAQQAAELTPASPRPTKLSNPWGPLGSRHDIMDLQPGQSVDLALGLTMARDAEGFWVLTKPSGAEETYAEVGDALEGGLGAVRQLSRLRELGNVAIEPPQRAPAGLTDEGSGMYERTVAVGLAGWPHAKEILWRPGNGQIDLTAFTRNDATSVSFSKRYLRGRDRMDFDVRLPAEDAANIATRQARAQIVARALPEIRSAAAKYGYALRKANEGGHVFGNLTSIYELEYKWSRLRAARAEGPLPDRAERMLSAWGEQLNRALDVELGRMQKAFTRWLRERPTDSPDPLVNRGLLSSIFVAIPSIDEQISLASALQSGGAAEEVFRTASSAAQEAYRTALEAQLKEPRTQVWLGVRRELAELEYAPRLPLEKKVVEFHRALTTAHNNGTMPEHIYAEPGLRNSNAAHVLTELSNREVPPEWDAEVRALLALPRGAELVVTAMPMPTELPAGWTFKQTFEEGERNIQTSLKLMREGRIKAILIAMKAHGDDVWVVARSDSDVHGYGAYLYEKLLDYASARGEYIRSDSLVSDGETDGALNVWRKYFERDDVETAPSPRTVKNFYGQYTLDDPALQLKYRKRAATDLAGRYRAAIERLRAAGAKPVLRRARGGAVAEMVGPVTFEGTTRHFNTDPATLLYPLDESDPEAVEYVELLERAAEHFVATAGERAEAAKRDRLFRKDERLGKDVSEHDFRGPLAGAKGRGRVWMYHATSSALLPAIARDGLRGDAPVKVYAPEWAGGHGTGRDCVYLHRSGSGPEVDGYLRNAVAKHGGEPVLLKVLVDGAELEPDPDDADLSVAAAQAMYCGTIPPEDIRIVTPGGAVKLAAPARVVSMDPRRAVAGMTLYHGSPSPEIAAFDISPAGRRHGYFGTGVYTTPHQEEAAYYGRYVYELRFTGRLFEGIEPVDDHGRPDFDVEGFQLTLNGARYVSWDPKDEIIEQEQAFLRALQEQYGNAVELIVGFSPFTLDDLRYSLEDLAAPGVDLGDISPEIVAALTQAVASFAPRSQGETYQISHDEIGQEVEAAGYDAVLIPGLEANQHHTEVLVFDPASLTIVAVHDTGPQRVGSRVAASADEGFDFDAACREVFGFATGDVVTVQPTEIRAPYPLNKEQAKALVEARGPRPEDLARPGKAEFYMDWRTGEHWFDLYDGYHRWATAELLGQPMQVEITAVRANPGWVTSGVTPAPKRASARKAGTVFDVPVAKLVLLSQAKNPIFPDQVERYREAIREGRLDELDRIEVTRGVGGPRERRKYVTGQPVRPGETFYLVSNGHHRALAALAENLPTLRGYRVDILSPEEVASLGNPWGRPVEGPDHREGELVVTAAVDLGGTWHGTPEGRRVALETAQEDPLEAAIDQLAGGDPVARQQLEEAAQALLAEGLDEGRVIKGLPRARQRLLHQRAPTAIEGTRLVQETDRFWVYAIDTYEGAEALSPPAWCFSRGDMDWTSFEEAGYTFLFYVDKRLGPPAAYAVMTTDEGEQRTFTDQDSFACPVAFDPLTEENPNPNPRRRSGELVVTAAARFLYHVTLARNLPSIGLKGLVPGTSQNFGGYGFHAKGRVFLTTQDGVSGWMHKIEYAANGGDGVAGMPVLLRVKVGEAKNRQPDELGDRDVGGVGTNFYVEHAIAPDAIEAWDGKSWGPVEAFAQLSDEDLEDALDALYQRSRSGDEDDDHEEVTYRELSPRALPRQRAPKPPPPPAAPESGDIVLKRTETRLEIWRLLTGGPVRIHAFDIYPEWPQERIDRVVNDTVSHYAQSFGANRVWWETPDGAYERAFATAPRSAELVITAAVDLGGTWWHGSGNETPFDTFQTSSKAVVGPTTSTQPIFLTRDRELARNYAGTRGYVYAVEISPSAKVFDPTDCVPADYTVSPREGRYWPPERTVLTPLGQAAHDHLAQMFPAEFENESEFNDVLKYFLKAPWDLMEDPRLMSWVKSLGFDGFRVTGDSQGLSVGIFDPGLLTITSTTPLDALSAQGGALVVAAQQGAPGPGAAPAATPQGALVALHNLSAGNLLHADKVGGLIAPSLAITRSDVGFENFGEITLVAPLSLVDPKTTPVFDADIYSPRYPLVSYETNRKQLDKIEREYADPIKRTKTYLGDADYKIRRDGYEGLLNNAAWKLAFLERVKGIKVTEPTRTVPVAHEWAGAPTMKTFLEQRGYNDNAAHYSASDEDKQYRRDITEAALRAIEEYYGGVEDPELRQDLIDTYKEVLLGRGYAPDELISMPVLSKLYESHKNLGKTEVDQNALRDHLDELITPYKAEYEAWATQLLQGVQGAPYLTSPGGKKMRYTTDNVLKLMTPKNVRGGEGFDYGLGNIRSKGARQFRSMDEMQRAIGQIVTREEFLAHKKVMEERYHELRSELADYHPAANDRYSSGRVWDAIGTSLGESFGRGKSLARELATDGFKNVSPALLAELEQFKRDLVAMPTEYFEAKPKRMVSLDEFIGAVVPVGARSEVTAVLAKHGLPVLTYDPEQPGTREAAIAQLAGSGRVAGLVVAGGFVQHAGRDRTAASDDVASAAAEVARRTLGAEREVATETVQITANDTVGPEDWDAHVIEGVQASGYGRAGRIVIGDPAYPPEAALHWAVEHGKPYVHNVWVAPDLRGHGVARLLYGLYRKYVTDKVMTQGPFSDAGAAMARALSDRVRNGAAGGVVIEGAAA